MDDNKLLEAHGKLVISLDFELLWGVRDVVGINEYGQHIKGVHKAIPRLLETFNRFNIRATFATVGFLFFENKAQLLSNLPDQFPSYNNKSLSPFTGHFETIAEDSICDPYHYAPHLIKLIQSYPQQEIGTHTFSHYYCLEPGQTAEQFKADIEQAQKIAKKNSLNLTSLVFPRNQFNNEYIKIIKESGIICYRGNEHYWIYRALNWEKESMVRRALRLLDAYINLTGNNCYSDDFLKKKFPVNIPSSRFLRPYSKKLRLLEKLRLQRITGGMTHAAKNKLTYHLWWHPHNFGINQDENFSFLEKILMHYKMLHQKYNFESYTMSQLAQSLI